MRPSFIAVLFLCAWTAVCRAQQPVPNHRAGPSRIVTTTRLVAQFSELERQWLKALADRDQPTLDGLMSEDFQEWNPQSVDPVPREDWRRQRIGTAAAGTRMQQMAVRDLGSTALVSFVLRTKTGSWFVVDAWQRQGEKWQVTDRYASRVTGGVNSPVRPSGKQ
jgi:uncharacterized protein DUF4440